MFRWLVVVGLQIICTVWGGNLFRRFCKMFSESWNGHWAALQLPCCPSKQGGLSENILQNLRNKPQTVQQSKNCLTQGSSLPLRREGGTRGSRVTPRVPFCVAGHVGVSNGAADIFPRRSKKSDPLSRTQVPLYILPQAPAIPPPPTTYYIQCLSDNMTPDMY